jgi:ABC-type phosphate/phosphonate transport system substrate-binding protein
VGSHSGVIEALYNRECKGGATYFDARDPFEDVYLDINQVVLPVETSPQIPIEGFSFATHVPTSQRYALVSALLNIASTDEGIEMIAIIGGGSEGLAQHNHSFFSGLEDLITAAGLTPEALWETYLH